MLVIGYGNELRGDDGVGPKVATATARLNLPNTRALACHQLTPEMAAIICKAGTVIFVDAVVDGSAGVGMRELLPREDAPLIAHTADPQSLLGFAKEIFGRCPPAWLLTIPIQNTEFGEELSPRALQGMEAALEKIRTLAGNPPTIISEAAG